MSTQGQGDVVAQLRDLSRHPRYHGVTWTSSEAAICGAAADELTRLRTLLSSSRGEQGWRTMDSAPKNDKVLGFVDGEVRLVMWCKTSHVPIYGWNLVDQGEDCDLCEPTHWMPLPSAPGSVPTSLAGQVPDAEIGRLRTLLSGEQGWRNALDELLGACQRYDADPCSTLAIADYLEAKDHAAEVLAAASSAPGSVPTSVAGHKILEGLRDAVAGDLPRVTIEGVTYVRQDAVSPEALLAESRQTIDALQTELDALKATSLAGQVPDGYVLVPIEPTPEMCDRGESRLVCGPLPEHEIGTPSATWAAAKSCYAAMLSAASPQPTAGGDADAK